jgi:HlyD family secretion protein
LEPPETVDLQSLKIERGTKPAARRRANPWPFRLLLLGALGVAGWLFWPQLAAMSDRLRLPEVKTAMVTESPAAAAAAIQGTAANGYIVAARRAALSSDVPGRIVELAVREGSVVKKGDIVARLYADEYRAALARAEADVATADANIARAKANLLAAAADQAQLQSAIATASAQREEAAVQQTFAESEVVRVDGLVQTGIGSQRDQERARTDAAAARARVVSLDGALATSKNATEAARQREEVARADVAVANAQRDAAAASRVQAQATLDKTDVRAPFDGIVVLKDAEVGEVVSPNVQGGGNARGAVCTMVDFDSLEVQANVPETTLSSVQLGAPADVFLDAFPEQRYPGTVDRIWPTADRQKATVEVRVKLARRDERLRPEMGVRIVFRAANAAQPVDAAANREVLLIAESAVVTIGKDTGVFVLDRDLVRFTPVTTGERRQGRIVIPSGLRPGQTIVLDPPTSLQDGDRVRTAAN